MQNKEYEYLDLLGKGLDPYQEKACCRTENTIIAAGAGSGKTQVLASRFAWLVMSKNIPANKILTLTFTNKAAAEMYQRIYQSLVELSKNPKTPAKEKARAKQAIEDFSEVHIQTLDSYCKNIVSQAANRYGISPDFSIGSSDSDLQLQALQFVLKHRENPTIQYYLADSDLQDFAQQYFYAPVNKFTTLAQPNNFFTEGFYKQLNEIVKAWNENIKTLKNIPSDLENHLAAIEDQKTVPFADDLRTLINNFPEIPTIDESKLLEEIQPKSFDIKPTAENSILHQIEIVSDWITSVSCFDFGKKSKLNTEIKEYQSLIANDVILFGIFSFFKECKYTKSFFELLDDFSNQVNETKRKTSSLSFADVSALAIKVLHEQKDILIQEQNAYNKIMIDEFQDNNKLNRDLLFLLSQDQEGNLNPQKLFFVGDEKQSIYKFRGADVSVFNELKNDLNTTPLQMIYNYRSNNSLLSSFNQLFSEASENNDNSHTAIFSATSDDSFEATFPLESHAKKSVITDEGKRIELEKEILDEKKVNAHICMLNEEFLESESSNKNAVSEDYLSKDNQIAYFIAKKIKDIYTEKKQNKEKIQFSDFAYLDKSRTNRRYIKNWLNHFEIPYVLDAQGDLFSEAPVNDIFSFFRLCVYPSDEMAYATFLHSPFAKLSLESVNAILAISKEEKDSQQSICFDESLTEKIQNSISPSDFENYQNAKSFFAENRHKVLSQPLTKSLTMLWYNTGYYYETLQNTKTNLLAEQYDLLFELARQCDTDSKNVAWFVDQLAALREKEKSSFSTSDDDEEIDIKDINYPIEKPDAVQIMTIHKSKGLQFKHVFIHGCMGKPKAATTTVFHPTEDFGISLRQKDGNNYFFEKDRDLENAKQLAEFKRVIYVAATRAEDDFYMLGSWKLAKKENTETQSLMQTIIRSYYPDAKNPDENLKGIVQYTDNAPFDFTSIEPVTTKEAYTKIDAKTSDDFYSNLFENYNTTQTLKTDILESNRKSPSDFGKEYYEKHKNDSIKADVSEQKSENYFDTSSATENSEASDGSVNSSSFKKNDYGTIAHAYLEAYALGQDVQTFSPAQKLFKDLSDEKIEKTKTECREFCTMFENSQLGKQFLACKNAEDFYKAEYGFRLYHEKTIFTGSIDLIFKNQNGKYTIVDYKTDEKIEPEVHKKQQEIYKIAATQLLKCNPEQIECYLFYLLHNKEVKLDL